MDFLGYIRRFASAIATDGAPQQRQRGVIRTAAVIFRAMREFKADSVDRIEEAVVSEIEAEAVSAKAVAEFKVSEAAEKQAMAAFKTAEADVQLAKADAIRRDARSKEMTALANSVVKLADAISKIKRAGGSVAFVEDEIVALLRTGNREFPQDAVLKEVSSELSEDPMTE